MAAPVESLLALVSISSPRMCFHSVSDTCCQEDLEGGTQNYGFSLASEGWEKREEGAAVF